MSNFDIRNFSFWYGPADLEIDPFLDSPWLEFAEILSNFKRGIFDQRNELIDLCRKCRDEKVAIFGNSK